MKNLFASFIAAALVAIVATVWSGSVKAAGSHPEVVTNNDLKGSNTVSFFKFTGTTLSGPATAPTGGKGIGGGFAGLNRIVLGAASANTVCGFVSDAGSDDIAVFKVVKKVVTKVGNFKDPHGSGKAHGIGLAVTRNFVFAAYSSTKNIGVWQILSGCSLKLSGTYASADVIAGMRAAPDFKTLVVGYGGVKKVGSFSIAANGKLTEHGPYPATGGASGVDISADSAYAIFGDTTKSSTQVEIYPINADGSLGKDNNFGGDGSLGAGVGSSNVWLSADEKFLFVSNNSSKQITSLAFGEAPLSLSYINITSLNNPGNETVSTAGMNTILTGYVVVAEDGSPDSSVGLLQINSDGSTTELSGSPFKISPGGPGLQSVMVGPPRPF